MTLRCITPVPAVAASSMCTRNVWCSGLTIVKRGNVRYGFFLCFPDAVCPYGVTMLVFVFGTCRDASTESDFVLNFKATRSFESGLSFFLP
jgi:hypothetical protein